MGTPMSDKYAGRLVKAEWCVKNVSLDVAKVLIRKWHYARGTSNTATYAHGLFRVGSSFWEADCAGVAWWLPPIKGAAVATDPDNWQGVLALSRLVVAPGVPKNACTFLLARSRRLIDRERWPTLVTYADEWRGHCGTIYLADNWVYAGLTKGASTFVLNGVLISRKAGPHTRTRAEMDALGATNVGRFRKHKFVHKIA